MEWTEREKEIAKQLTQPEVKEFLEKILLRIDTQNGEELKKNIVALDDAQYGQLMKVLYLVKKENRAKLHLITRIATSKKEGDRGVVAPK